MKRKFFSVLLTAAFTAAAVAGCKQNVGTPEDNAVVEETDEDEDQDEETRVFGFSSTDMSNPFYETIQESVRTTLEEQGDRLIVTDPKSDVNKQISQIRDMIESGVDAVFLCPADAEKITPALEALDEAGIPVVNLDIRVSESDLTEAFIGSDNTNAGYVCGEDLISRRPDGGRIVIVENPEVSSLNERITGFEEAIADAGFEVVTRISVSDDLSGIKAEMDQILQNEDEPIDAVMCGNDRMALQILDSLEEAGRTDVLVYSVDGSPEIKSALSDPESPIAGIGAESPISMGKNAARTAEAILDREDYEEEICVETFFINRDNVEMYGTDGWQ